MSGHLNSTVARRPLPIFRYGMMPRRIHCSTVRAVFPNRLATSAFEIKPSATFEIYAAPGTVIGCDCGVAIIVFVFRTRFITSNSSIVLEQPAAGRYRATDSRAFAPAVVGAGLPLAESFPACFARLCAFFLRQCLWMAAAA